MNEFETRIQKDCGLDLYASEIQKILSATRVAHTAIWPAAHSEKR
jgi:hypothetical protein